MEVQSMKEPRLINAYYFKNGSERSDDIIFRYNKNHEGDAVFTENK